MEFTKNAVGIIPKRLIFAFEKYVDILGGMKISAVLVFAILVIAVLVTGKINVVNAADLSITANKKLVQNDVNSVGSDDNIIISGISDHITVTQGEALNVLGGLHLTGAHTSSATFTISHNTAFAKSVNIEGVLGNLGTLNINTKAIFTSTSGTGINANGLLELSNAEAQHAGNVTLNHASAELKFTADGASITSLIDGSAGNLTINSGIVRIGAHSKVAGATILGGAGADLAKMLFNVKDKTFTSFGGTSINANGLMGFNENATTHDGSVTLNGGIISAIASTTTVVGIIEATEIGEIIEINSGTINVKGSGHDSTSGSDKANATLKLDVTDKGSINIHGGSISISGGTGTTVGDLNLTTATLTILNAKEFNMKGGTINIAAATADRGAALLNAQASENFNVDGGIINTDTLTVSAAKNAATQGLLTKNLTINGTIGSGNTIGLVKASLGTSIRDGTLTTSALQLHAASSAKSGLITKFVNIDKNGYLIVNSDLSIADITSGTTSAKGKIGMKDTASLKVGGTLTLTKALSGTGSSTLEIDLHNKNTALIVQDLVTTQNNSTTLDITQGSLNFIGTADNAPIASQFITLNIAADKSILSLGTASAPNLGGIYAGAINADGIFNVLGGQWTVTDAVILNSATATLNVRGGNLLLKDNLSLGNAAIAAVNISGGTVTVDGMLDIARGKEVNVIEGVLTLGGDINLAGTSKITVGGLHPSGAASSGATLNLTGNASSGLIAGENAIVIGNLGIVEATKAQLITIDERAKIANLFDIAAGGVLSITGYDNTIFTTAAAYKLEMAKYDTAIFGQIKFDAKYTGPVTGAELASGWHVADAVLTATAATIENAPDINVTVAHIELSGAGADITLDNVSNLGLVNANNDYLIKAKNSSNVQVATHITLKDKGVLTLGNTIATANASGRIKGNITLSTVGSTGTMNVVNGNYTIEGMIDGGDGTNTLNIKDAGLRVSDSLGGTNGIGIINSTNSHVNAEKSVNVGVLNVLGGTFTVKNNLDLALSSSIKGGGAAKVSGFLNLADYQNITVGSNEMGNTGSLSIGSLVAGDGTALFAASAWNETKAGSNNAEKQASQIAISGGISYINSHLIAGQAGQIAVGTADTSWLAKQISHAGAWGAAAHEITAAFGITGSPHTIGGTYGGITVNGIHNGVTPPNPASSSIAPAEHNTALAGGAYFGANSLFVIDASIMSGSYGPFMDNTALTGSNTIFVHDTAKLLLINIAAGKTYKIVSSVNSALNTTAGWQNIEGSEDKLFFDNIFLNGTVAPSTTANNFDISVNQIPAASILPTLDNSLAQLVDYAVAAGIVSGSSMSGGGRFIFSATHTLSPSEAAATIEGASKLGIIGGVASSIASVSNTNANNIHMRTTLSPNPYIPITPDTYSASAPSNNAASVNYDGEVVELSALSRSLSGMVKGFGLWLMPMYQNHNAYGFESGNFNYDYNSDFYGISIGSDYTPFSYFRFGLNFHLGTGTVNSSGDFAPAQNNFDSYGASFYAGYHFLDFSITTDLGYTISENHIKQNSSLGVLSTISQSDIFTAGLRAEYLFFAFSLDIIPYLGIRANYINLDSFHTNIMGATVFSTAKATASTLQFPLGVSLSKKIKIPIGWTINPKVGLGFTYTAGDTSIKQDVSIPNLATIASMDSDIFDPISIQGSLGIALLTNHLSIALDYSLNISEHVINHGIYGSLRYEF